MPDTAYGQEVDIRLPAVELQPNNIESLQRELEQKNQEIAELRRQLAERTQQRDNALELAGRDPLTEILNRRGGEERCHSLLAQAARGEIQLVYCRIDIDHFKMINDEYGHSQGDKVLKQLAELLNKSKRDTDLFYRYGGEEFDLVLTVDKDLHMHTAGEVIGRHLDLIRTLFRDPQNAEQLTASIGATMIKAGENISLDEAQIMADETLYNAKRNGRNRINLTYAHDHYDENGFTEKFNRNTIIWDPMW